MADYATMYTAIHTAASRNRVQMAVMIKAVNVYQNKATSDQQSINLSRSVLAGNYTCLDLFMYACVTNATVSPTIQTDGTMTAADSDLQTVVNNSWQIIAGTPTV